MQQRSISAIAAFAVVAGVLSLSSRRAAAQDGPRVDAITPKEGGAGGWVTLRVSGAGLTAQTALVLACPEAIVPTDLKTTPDGSLLAAMLDLRTAPPGTCDVTLTDGVTSRTLSAAFTIAAAKPPAIWARLATRNALRANGPNNVQIAVGNNGNVDGAAFVTLAGIPAGCEVSLVTPHLSVGTVRNLGAGEPPIVHDGPGGRFVQIELPSVPPGSPTWITFSVQGPALGERVKLRALWRGDGRPGVPPEGLEHLVIGAI